MVEVEKKGFQSLVDYSEEDAERDAQLYLSECYDLSLSACLEQDEDLSSQNTEPEERRVLDTVAKHLQNVRFLRFAEEALGRESERESERERDWEMVDRGSLDCSAAEPLADSLSNSEPVSVFVPLPAPLSDAPQHISSSPLSLPLCAVTQSMTSSAASSSSSSAPSSSSQTIAVRKADTMDRAAALKQLRKDIERDRLLLNGVRIVGAALGLDLVSLRLKHLFAALCEECALPTLSERDATSLSLSVLLTASRTHSGALAFQALQSLIDPRSYMLIPLSQNTPPMQIRIEIGVFDDSAQCIAGEKHTKHDESYERDATDHEEAHGNTEKYTENNEKDALKREHKRIGFICRIRCESRYRVQRRADEMFLTDHDDNNHNGGVGGTNTNGDVTTDTHTTAEKDDAPPSLCEQMLDRVVCATFEDVVFHPLSLSLSPSLASHMSEREKEESGKERDDTSVPVSDGRHGRVLISLL